VRNEGIEEALFQFMVDVVNNTPFYGLLGIELLRVGPGFAELAVATGEQHTNPVGVIHGGLLMSLADAAMGNAVRSLGIKAVTVDCSTLFTSPVLLGEKVVAKGKVIKAGKSMIFARAEIWSDDKLVSSAEAAFYKTGEVSL